MEADAVWESLVKIVRRLSEPRYGPPLKGSFHIDSADALADLSGCIAAEPDTHLRLLECEVADLYIGKTIEIEISPRLGFGLITPNINSLLRSQYALIKEPSRFFLLEDAINYTDELQDDHPLVKYRAVLSFIGALKRIAAFLEPDEPSLIFISDGKFEIPVIYDEKDLNLCKLADLNELNLVMPYGVHEKQCGAILAEVVVEMTRHLPNYERFRYLLAHLQNLKKRYDDGYELFASGFSYEKIRNEVEAARVEFTGKIHEVFSDIQNQVLSIPVATIVVATQMKDAKAIGYEFWVNTAVLSGCWVFAILMWFLLHNQTLTLAVLNDEINRQKRQIGAKKEYAGIADSFADIFKSLDHRVRNQRMILWSIAAIVFFGFLLSNLVYFKLTLPAYSRLMDLVSWLLCFINVS